MSESQLHSQHQVQIISTVCREIERVRRDCPNTRKFYFVLPTYVSVTDSMKAQVISDVLQRMNVDVEWTPRHFSVVEVVTNKKNVETKEEKVLTMGEMVVVRL